MLASQLVPVLVVRTQPVHVMHVNAMTAHGPRGVTQQALGTTHPRSTAQDLKASEIPGTLLRLNSCPIPVPGNSLYTVSLCLQLPQTRARYWELPAGGSLSEVSTLRGVFIQKHAERLGWPPTHTHTHVHRPIRQHMFAQEPVGLSLQLRNLFHFQYCPPQP